jgi:uncharacterized protein (TIGR02246 family)
MTKRILHFLTVIAACLTLNSCSQKQTANTDAERTKVKSVVDNFKNIWETEDMNLVSKIIAHDSDIVIYGTDANENFVGWEAVKGYFSHMFPVIEKTKLRVRNQIIKVAADGNAAWFSETLDWDLMFGGQPAQLPNTRLTGVLEKRDGNWVIVQIHNSIPVKQ